MSSRTVSNASLPQPAPKPNVAVAEPAKPQRRHFSHKFWSPELAPFRGAYLKALIATVCLTICVMWMALPAYWGSLAHQRSYSNKLHVFFINRDASDVGNSIQSVVEQNIQNTTHKKLGWRIVDPQEYPTDDDAVHAMLDEKAWMVVIVPTNTTANLIAARASGDSSYDPTKAIQVYYAQARNELASANFLVPYSEALLSEAAFQFGQQYTKEFLTSQAGNATAIQAAANAPQTISTPVWYTMNNLRPFSAPVASALLLVGSIYIIIFSFVMTLAGYAVRAPLEPFLTTAELLRLRVCAPLVLYVPLSFSYSMISLAFKVPFGAHFGYGGGFFLYWVFVYMTMASLGLATEFAVQILTPRFMTFFLLPLIISNVSVASLPLQLEPWFYKYGYGFPVFNNGLATRTLIFNTKNHMGRNAGVLIAWIALSLITITSITLWQRRNHRRAIAREAAGGVEAGNGSSNTPGKLSAPASVREVEVDEDAEEYRPEDVHEKMVDYIRGEKTEEQEAEGEER